jgi:hypothetical protein
MLFRNWLIIAFCAVVTIGFFIFNNHSKTRADQLFEDLANAGIELQEDIDSQILQPVNNRSFGLEVPAIIDFEEVIRLREDDSWSTFDYICSVYNGNPPRIQLIIQEFWDGKDIPGYIIKERILTRQEYESIWEKVIKDSIHIMPHDLEPNSTQTWGYYYIALKSGDFVKMVTWQDLHNYETDQKEKAVVFYYELLKYAGLPNPKGLIYFVDMKNDSAYFKVAINTFKFIKDASIQYKGQDIQQNNKDEWNLAIPLKDTLQIQSNLVLKTIMDNNDTLEIKEFRFIDLRKK